MTRIKNLKSGIHALLNKSRIEAELDEELEGYLHASTEHKRSSGIPDEAARRQALKEMGSRDVVKHQVWSSRWESIADGIFQDIRLSFRSLANHPGFTLIALLSLALGIGANTAIFTLIHQVLLRNLPVESPEQLVTFGPSLSGGVNAGIDVGTMDLYPYTFARQVESQPGPFQSIASYSSFPDRVTALPPQTGSNQHALGGKDLGRNEVSSENGASGAGDTSSTQVSTSLVSGNYFATVGVTPLLGRTISLSDTTGDNAAPGRNPVVVVSYHYWQQQLSSDPAVLGESLTINRIPFRIIGVLPSAFLGFSQEIEPVALYVPMPMQQQIMLQSDLLSDRGLIFLHMIARRKSASMNADGLKHDQLWINRQVRAYIRGGEGAVIPAERQREIELAAAPLTAASHGVSRLSQQFGESLQILIIITGLVLLIACANLANFLLARAATRQREIATRLALGSSRSRIIRQSLIETLLLSLLGGVLGLALAFVATRALISFVSQGANYTALDPMPDLTVLLFTFAISLFTGLLFGLGPALTAARTGAAESLSSNARMTTGSKAARLFPRVLVTAQVMFSLFLLVGAGLFLRSLKNLQSQDFGFERSHLLLAQFAPKLAGYRSPQIPALHRTIVDRLEAIPGVKSASLSLTPPIGNGNWGSTLDISGYVPKPKENMFSVLNRVSGHYFETTGISIVQGRAINDNDSATNIKVAVINEAMARRFFPKGDAIGRTFKVEIDDVAGPWQIVGIAHDSRIGNPRDPEIQRMVYLPLNQMTGAPAAVAAGSNAPAPPAPQGDSDNGDAYAQTIEIRTVADPSATISSLRTTIKQIDRNLPLMEIRTIRQQVDDMMSQQELISSLTAVFSALALVLAAIGLYGVMSYSVVRRTSEIGIRLALGAQTRSVLWMVLRESLLLLAIGLGLGLPLTLLTTRVAADFLKAQLFGLNAVDPAIFATAIAVVAGMTLLAAWLPARRAAHVDPMIALRCD